MKSNEQGTAPKRKAFVSKTTSSLLVLILFGVAVHLLLPQITVLEHSLHVIKNMSTWAVGLAVLAQILSYVGSGLLLQAVIELTYVKISLIRSVLISLAATSIGLIAGGIVGSSASVFSWMRGTSDKPQTAMLASTLPPFINNLTLVIVSIFGLLHLLAVHDLSQWQTLSFVLMVLFTGFIIFAVIWGVQNRKKTVFLVDEIAKKGAALLHRSYQSDGAETSLQNLFEAWDVLVAKGWQRTVLGAAINVVFDMLTLYFLFIAAGNPISPSVLIVGYGIPILLGKMAFMIPGGVGVVEGSMVALYTGLGVPESVTVVVVLIYRAISFWLPTLIGFPVAAYLQRDAVKIRQ